MGQHGEPKYVWGDKSKEKTDVGRAVTDDEIEGLERKYKQLSSSKGNPIAGLKLCLARKLDIPWPEVSEIDVQSYIDAAEDLGVK